MKFTEAVEKIILFLFTLNLGIISGWYGVKSWRDLIVSSLIVFFLYIGFWKIGQEWKIIRRARRVK